MVTAPAFVGEIDPKEKYQTEDDGHAQNQEEVPQLKAKKSAGPSVGNTSIVQRDSQGQQAREYQHGETSFPGNGVGSSSVSEPV